MQYALAPLAGVLITVMNAVNSRFSFAVGNLPSSLVVHLVGLTAACAVLAARPERRGPERPPLYLYSGGIVGVGTIVCCNIAYGNMDMQLAVAFALLGQTVFAVFVDATGFLGRKKYPVGIGTLPGLALALTGIAVISGSDFGTARYAPVAVLAGILPAFSFILNSRLAERIGIFRSTRANYVTGLSATLVAAALSSFTDSASPLRSPLVFLGGLIAAGPVLVLGGGLLGVIMIGTVNFAFPRLPALYATLLIFSGQALAGVALDSALGGSLDVRQLAGIVIVLAGLTLNAAVADTRARGPRS